MHAHGLRSRCLLGEVVSSEPSLVEVVLIAVFRCAACGATWRVLPGFVARWVHRSWRVVSGALASDVQGSRFAPVRTRRRWAARLLQSALVPIQLLALSLDSALRSLAQGLGLRASRDHLLAAFASMMGGCPFSGLAELLHRLQPGVRLM